MFICLSESLWTVTGRELRPLLQDSMIYQKGQVQGLSSAKLLRPGHMVHVLAAVLTYSRPKPARKIDHLGTMN